MDVLLLLLFALVVGASLAIYLRIFRHVYGRGNGKVGTDRFTRVDGILALGVVVYLLLQIFIGLSFSRHAPPLNLSAELIVATVLIQWILILGPILVALRMRGMPVGAVFGFDRVPVLKALGWGFLLLLAGLPLVFASSAVMSRFLNTDPNTDVQEVVKIFQNASEPSQRIAIIVLAVVVAPVAEELAFRGYVYGVLKRFFGAIPSLCFSGVMFALIHLNAPALLPLFLLACVFTIAYEVSGSLLVPMAMHALFNTLNIFGMLFLAK
jgi:uncharacterized protein